MSGPVVTIVGGGVWAARLCEILAAALGDEGELRLIARRAETTRLIAAHAAARARRGWRIGAPASLAEALEGSAAVVLLVRIGGAAARAHDEAFPARHGLAGDEGLGPGGVANAWRTVPALTPIAREIRARCPGAFVANLVAPLGVTTRLLLDEGLDAAGVCELPGVVLADLVARLGVTPGDLAYAGLNHVGWFWPRTEAATRTLASAAEEATIDSLTWHRYGAVPLPYVHAVFDPVAADRLGVARPPGRAGVLADLARRLLDRFAAAPGGPAPELDARPTPWFDRALAPLLAARLGREPHDGFANVRNGTGLPLLEAVGAEAIVETRARVTATGVVPRSDGAPPTAVAAFLAAAWAAEDLAYQAARTRDPELVRRALEVLPLPRRLDPAEVDALTREATA